MKTTKAAQQHFFDQSPETVERIVTGWGESPYRARQAVQWVYEKKIDSFAQATSLPLAMRERLEQTFRIYSLSIEGKERSRLDGTVRYHFKTHDGLRIATVLLPKKDRHSVCVSTQAGCTMSCMFCVTGTMKFKRNLSRGEILEQILLAERDSGQKINGVLLMGMGEPLLNYDNVVAALNAMVDHTQLGIGRRHVTLSTVGLVPQIRKLADEHLGVRLALSLHAADPKIRYKIAPKVPFSVDEILAAGLYYCRKNRARLTVEYTMVAGLNDTLEAAQKLVELIEEHAKTKDDVQVNLIPCNRAPEHRCAPPSEEHMQRFKHYLDKHSIFATVREAKGADIGSACGQLGV